MQLTSKQQKFLRGLGHHLQPSAMLGREGITKPVIKSVMDVLIAHELIKVKIQENCPLERHDAATQIADSTGSNLVQVIGRIALLYRPNTDLQDDERIKLN
ncbi:MAG: ribosome assembly RNA-binding protein YhbY [Proteobacteria bacterium]|nr:ribosome assembly RNA-binding protein YhbY [Pseudomonadota bacterium]MBU1685835.1 ribosome assembly RNA-binding protein YhbY [Pseudomonadota bacterium]